MKALIVDGEELLRLSLKEVILVSGNFQEVLEATSQHEFLAKTANHDDISLVIVHPTSLGDDGRDCIKLVNRLYPDAAIIMMVDHESQRFSEHTGAITIARNASVAQMVTTIRRALKLPLDGFGAVASSPATPNVRSALQNAAGNGTGMQPTVADSIDLNRLSYRQKQILAMAADGLPNKEIAARLNIAEGTVKAHMHAIFKVLGVSNRTQAVIRYGAVGRAAPAPAASSPAGASASWDFAAAS